MDNAKRRVLILGMGNTIVSDDGVGIEVVRCAARLLEEMGGASSFGITIRESALGGFGLIDLFDGYDSAVIVDAFRGPPHACGDLVELRENAFCPTSHLVAGHQIDLPTALSLGTMLGRKMPSIAGILGVLVQCDTTFGETLTESVAACVPVAARRAVALAIECAGASEMSD